MTQLSKMEDASGNQYKTSIFWPQAQAAYAKAVIFTAEAKFALKTGEYIWASISCYYSLFHLTISLMFMLPRLIEQEKLKKLISARKQGVSDPTPFIKHNEPPDFLTLCESRGLTGLLRAHLKKARELREFVNYRPRTEWQGDKLIFRTRSHKLSDVNEVVESLESLLGESLVWASKQGDSAELLAFVSVASIKQFLNQNDLLYKEWCPPQVLEEAEVIRQNLPIRIKE